MWKFQIRALVNQEIADDNSQQMVSFWRLFKDNNYMMGKLFDEESIFPAVLGSCGPYYATEGLEIVQSNPSIMQYLWVLSSNENMIGVRI